MRTIEEADALESVYVALRIEGQIDPAVVNQMLGVSATSVENLTSGGIDRVLWVYEEKHPYSHQLGDIIGGFVGKLPKRSAELRSLAANAEIAIYCAIYSRFRPSILLTREALRSLVSVDCPIGIDIYKLRELEGDIPGTMR